MDNCNDEYDYRVRAVFVALSPCTEQLGLGNFKGIAVRENIIVVELSLSDNATKLYPINKNSKSISNICLHIYVRRYYAWSTCLILLFLHRPLRSCFSIVLKNRVVVVVVTFFFLIFWRILKVKLSNVGI